MRTIDWSDGAVVIVDQTALPHEVRQVHLTDVDGLVNAIQRLAVRGAPALGAAGALGVVLALDEAGRESWDDDELAAAIAGLEAARPTAVNLSRGVARGVAAIPE